MIVNSNESEVPRPVSLSDLYQPTKINASSMFEIETVKLEFT